MIIIIIMITIITQLIIKSWLPRRPAALRSHSDNHNNTNHIIVITSIVYVYIYVFIR